jgi:hypothetical protein
MSMFNTIVFFIEESSSIQTMKTVLETLAAAFPDVPSISQSEVVNVPGNKQPMVKIPIPVGREKTIMTRLEVEMAKTGLHMAKPS